MRKTSIIALTLFLLDSFLLGSIVIGMVLLFIVLPYLLINAFRSRKDRDRLKQYLFSLTAYSLAIALIIAAFALNSRISTSRADTLIRACSQYRLQQGHYPAALSDLVPQYIDKVPLARYTVLFNDFKYIQGSEPLLMYIDFPPFGKKIYDFQRARWLVSD